MKQIFKFFSHDCSLIFLIFLLYFLSLSLIFAYIPPGEISWHPLTGAIAQLFTLWWFEVCLQVVTCKLHVQLEFSLNSWVIS
jgi:hypothetical protein